MSDALSDIGQDKRIVDTLSEIKDIEDKFNESPSREGAEKLIGLWNQYRTMKRGFSSNPNRGLALERIECYVSFLEGEIFPGQQRDSPEVENEQKFYFAVGGHGRIMGGNLEEVIKKSLEQKYGIVPHAFKIIIDEDNYIVPEEISCDECPNSINEQGCDIKQDCNCFNSQRYSEKREIINKGKKYVKGLERENRRKSIKRE
jgi:hypothetical protein